MDSHIVRVAFIPVLYNHTTKNVKFGVVNNNIITDILLEDEFLSKKAVELAKKYIYVTPEWLNIRSIGVFDSIQYPQKIEGKKVITVAFRGDVTELVRTHEDMELLSYDELCKRGVKQSDTTIFRLALSV
jgi:hypothetical protein